MNGLIYNFEIFIKTISDDIRIIPDVSEKQQIYIKWYVNFVFKSWGTLHYEQHHAIDLRRFHAVKFNCQFQTSFQILFQSHSIL